MQCSRPSLGCFCRDFVFIHQSILWPEHRYAQLVELVYYSVLDFLGEMGYSLQTSCLEHLLNVFFYTSQFQITMFFVCVYKFPIQLWRKENRTPNNLTIIRSILAIKIADNSTLFKPISIPCLNKVPK